MGYRPCGKLPWWPGKPPFVQSQQLDQDLSGGEGQASDLLSADAFQAEEQCQFPEAGAHPAHGAASEEPCSRAESRGVVTEVTSEVTGTGSEGRSGRLGHYKDSFTQGEMRSVRV